MSSTTSPAPQARPTHQPQLVMRRPDLAGLPALALPPDVRLHTLGPGDDQAWERIIGRSFGWASAAGKFDLVMRADTAFKPQRVFFICRGDEPVGTASAWHVPRWGEDVGCLHYVGILPEHAGHGLGGQVSLACLRYLVYEGRRSAMLLTDDFRLPAIRTYLRLGFEPLVVHENQRQRWRDAFQAIGSGELAERFAAALAAPLHVM